MIPTSIISAQNQTRIALAVLILSVALPKAAQETTAAGLPSWAHWLTVAAGIVAAFKVAYSEALGVSKTGAPPDNIVKLVPPACLVLAATILASGAHVGCTKAQGATIHTALVSADQGLVLNEQACRIASDFVPNLPEWVRVECAVDGVVEPIVLLVQRSAFPQVAVDGGSQ